jgi:glutamine amidotransferase PdxT
LGGPVLFLNMIDSDRQRTAQLNITYATCAGLILITSAIFGRENVSVPIPSNIEYNRSLAREIESMKKKIFVGVKIEKNP